MEKKMCYMYHKEIVMVEGKGKKKIKTKTITKTKGRTNSTQNLIYTLVS